MLMTFKKYCKGSVAVKVIFIFISLIFSFQSHGQEDEKKDTVVYDTTEALEPLPEEQTDTEGSTEEEKYFFKRSDTLSVQVRNIPAGVTKKMKEDKEFWYANADLKNTKTNEKIIRERRDGKNGQKEKNEQALKEQQQRDASYVPLGQRSWFQTLLWIITIGAFAAVLIMYLSGSNVGLFRKKNVITAKETEEDFSTEDIFAINYQKEIDKAVSQGNYRLAIRLQFLRLLKNMSEKNIIRYKQDKTNLDYLMELHPTGYYNNFFRITRNYEYSWYGQFNVSEDAYKIIRNDFDKIDKDLR